MIYCILDFIFFTFSYSLFECIFIVWLRIHYILHLHIWLHIRCLWSSSYNLFVLGSLHYMYRWFFLIDIATISARGPRVVIVAILHYIFIISSISLYFTSYFHYSIHYIIFSSWHYDIITFWIWTLGCVQLWGCVTITTSANLSRGAKWRSPKAAHASKPYFLVISCRVK